MTPCRNQLWLHFTMAILSVFFFVGCGGRPDAPGDSSLLGPGSGPGTPGEDQPAPIYNNGDFMMKHPIEGPECIAFCENNCETAVQCKLADDLTSMEECVKSCSDSCEKKKISVKYLDCATHKKCEDFVACFAAVDESDEKIDLNPSNAVKDNEPPQPPGDGPPDNLPPTEEKPDAAPSADTPATAAVSEETPDMAPEAPPPPPSGNGEPSEPVPTAPATPPSGDAESGGTSGNN